VIFVSQVNLTSINPTVISTMGISTKIINKGIQNQLRSSQVIQITLSTSGQNSGKYGEYCFNDDK